MRNVTTLWLKFQRESTKLLAERAYMEFLSYAEFFLLLSDVLSEPQYSTLSLLRNPNTLVFIINLELISFDIRLGTRLTCVCANIFAVVNN